MQFSGVLVVDPGASGCAVFIAEDGTTLDFIRFINTSISEQFAFFQKYRKARGGMERLFIQPRDIKKRSGSISQMLKNAGKVQALFELNGIPFEEFTPQTWQMFFGVYGKGKSAAVTKAKEKFQGLKVVNDMADALLQAKYFWWQTFMEI